jgi:putative ABC transport system permease protein
MSLWESFKTAWQSIFANKMRSSLTMLGIVIGVLAVVLLVALGQGFQTSMTATFESMGASALYVSSSSDRSLTTVRHLTFEDAEALQDPVLAPSLGAVSPTLTQMVSASYGNNSINVQVTGVMPNILDIRNYELENGRFLNDTDINNRQNVAVLGYQAAADLFGTESPLGKSIRIAGSRYQVVGTFKKMGGFAGDSYILMPLPTMQSRITGGNTVQQIAVKAKNSENVDAAIAEITAIMRARHYIKSGTTDDFSIRDMREILNTMQQNLATFSIFLSSVGAISLLVGSIGIMNIMLVSVSERTREIGIRKAIGAKRRDILVQFLIEAAAISFTGGIIGLALGVAVSMLMGNLDMGGTTISAEISPSIVALALGVAIGTGLVSGTYPAMRAARMDPIESLRHE